MLSIFGIRFTDALFFYINPLWWFIWLILQLYMVFPLLYISLRKLPVGRFLLLACLFTFLSRLLGLFGLRYSESLYFWMLGIFFGTRLAEFCAGMALAVLLKESVRGRAQQLAEPKYIFLFSILILSLGLASFFIRYGSLVDYFLVTLGLSGLSSIFGRLCLKRENGWHSSSQCSGLSHTVYTWYMGLFSKELASF
ncbi:MAG: acyltransferase family protein [Microcoleus sp.]